MIVVTILWKIKVEDSAPACTCLRNRLDYELLKDSFDSETPWLDSRYFSVTDAANPDFFKPVSGVDGVQAGERLVAFVRNPLYETKIQFQSNCELKSYFYSYYRFIRFNLVLDISFMCFASSCRLYKCCLFTLYVEYIWFQ
jgi:hypothetical protein